MKRTGPACSVCEHPQRSDIDADRRSAARVAKQFGVSSSAIYRHRQHEASEPAPQPKPTPPPPVPPAAPPPSGEIDPRAVVVENLSTLRALASSADDEDRPAIANAITTATRLLAQLTGSLQVTQSQILRSASWARIERVFESVFARHPEAARALQEFATELQEIGE